MTPPAIKSQLSASLILFALGQLLKALDVRLGFEMSFFDSGNGTWAKLEKGCELGWANQGNQLGTGVHKLLSRVVELCILVSCGRVDKVWEDTKISFYKKKPPVVQEQELTGTLKYSF